MIRSLQKFSVLLFFSCLLLAGKSFAGIEPYENFKKGIAVNDTLSVQDEKFRNPLFNWGLITNISVQNSVTLRILDEQLISQSFSCQATLRIEYYSDPAQTQPTQIQSVVLNVNYSKAAGATYKVSDSYHFTNGYKVKVYVTALNSPQYGSSLPPVLQLSSSIVIDRQYQFNAPPPANAFQPYGVTEPLKPTATFLTQGQNRQLKLCWTLIPGAEEYDIEWAVVDSGSRFETLIGSMKAGTTINEDTIATLFRNNATRITTPGNECLVSLIYNNDFLAVRMRQVQYDASGIRKEGPWSYEQTAGDSPYCVWSIKSYWHEPGMNWQYSAAFAEDAKKKEVISYFDGSLRGRQTATLNSTDHTAVVQENVFDEFGRQAASILPAPVREGSVQFLHYFQNFNLDSLGRMYSFSDINSAACELLPGKLSTSAGSSAYYSAANPFIGEQKYNKYIPDAEGYPLSVTQYTPDNTGRIRLQGGVGPAFQPGKSNPSHTTRYYYSKPEQWELDRLFGNDVGLASHYLKNMVIDPNGQISISYLNASGKTIATALTGPAPGSQDALASLPVKNWVKNNLIRSDQFSFNATELRFSATTTYTASVPGTDTISYNVEKLISRYPGGAFKPCSNCYYELSIHIKDDCNNTIYQTSQPVQIGSQQPDSTAGGVHTASFNVNFQKIGEYYVSFELAMSRQVIAQFTDRYISDGQQNGAVKKEFEFIQNYLQASSFSGLFSDCKTCNERLGTKAAFTAMFTAKLRELQADSAGLAGAAYNTWVGSVYDSLKTACTAMQAGCYTLAVSPCASYEKLMLEDVSPGGQYALFDSNGQVLESELNVLYNHFRQEFPEAAPGSTLYNSELITTASGDITSPYAASFTLANLLSYWKPEWAAKFLKYHPEFCKLQSCNSNAVYMSWDNEVKERIEKDADIAGIPGAAGGLHYDRNNAAWLLAADPFFKPGAGGYAYADSMQHDLNNYSTAVLNYTAAGTQVKSLTGYVDFLLYCSNTKGNMNSAGNASPWNNCSPVASCRVPDREWQYYRDSYFEMKEKYYKRLRDANCSTCTVGTPYAMQLPGTLATTDFQVSTYSGPLPACNSGEQQVSISYNGGALKQAITVQLYYPGQTAVLNVAFAAGDSQKVICVPGNLPVNSIKVSALIP